MEVKNDDLFNELEWQNTSSILAWFQAVTGEGKDDLYLANADYTEAVKTDGTGILGDDNKMQNLACWIDCEEPPKGRIFELGWVCGEHYLGKPLFSFDRKKILSFPQDCAKVTPAQLKLALDVFGLQVARSCTDSDFSGECLEVWKKWRAGDAGKEEF